MPGHRGPDLKEQAVHAFLPGEPVGVQRPPEVEQHRSRLVRDQESVPILTMYMVEAVGIEPTSGNPQPQASTPLAGLSYDSLAPRSSSRQEGHGASLIGLARPLRQGSEPATGI